MFRKLIATSLIFGITAFSFPSAQAEPLAMVGGQRDQHGCLTPAGYSWSAVQSQCIRIWETGEKVTDSANPTEWAGSYAVFSKDGSQAELFLADQQMNPILEKQENGYGNAGFHLLKQNGGWQLIRLNSTQKNDRQ